MLVSILFLVLTCTSVLGFHLPQIIFNHPVHTQRPSYTIDGHLMETNWQPFQSFPDRLQQTLNRTAILNLTDAFNDLSPPLFTQPLIVPEEARVVVISEAEFKQLQTVGITMSDVEKIAFNRYMQYTIMKAECFGIFKHHGSEDDGVVYLRLSARVWTYIREDVEKLYIKKGGEKGGFDKNKFWPHVTVSGTKDGLKHEGCVRFKDGCWADVVVGDMWGFFFDSF